MDKEIPLIEITEESIESMVYEIRGQKVMLDFNLARIYGYTTRDFNNQIKHNIERFDNYFRFQITKDEAEEILRWKNPPRSCKRKESRVEEQHSLTLLPSKAFICL